MERGFSDTFKRAFLIGDLVCLTVAFLVAFFLRYDVDRYSGQEVAYLFLLAIILVSWAVISINWRLYSLQKIQKWYESLFDIIRGIFLLFLVITTVVFIGKIEITSRLVIGFFSVFALVLLTLWRFVFAQYIEHKKVKLHVNYIIIGAGRTGRQLSNTFKHQPALGYRFLGFFDDTKASVRNENSILGNFDEVFTYMEREQVDEVFITMPDLLNDYVREVIAFAENHLIRVKIVPDLGRYVLRNISVDFFDNFPIITIRKEPLSRYTFRVIKRAFDVVFALLVIVLLLSWLLPILAILIKLDSKGPVFFIQERNGENNDIFRCIKLRTMKVNAQANSLQAQKNDSRITRLGRFLRKSNLDEVPQFINVLKGEMSVVGPRPHMLKHTEEYSRLIDRYLLRHSIKPGITGWAQIKGFRGETKTSRAMRLRVLHDVWYMENWSFLLDLQIIIYTVLNMLKGEKNAG
ncbi:MAG: undecaprenyl-phosphate glucose phosphotransferase [Bacteroidota bacterium]|nr:undecaprenyl-phosphate glucose phosphotransferase [Bacteroidota bacterium]